MTQNNENKYVIQYLISPVQENPGTHRAAASPPMMPCLPPISMITSVCLHFEINLLSSND